MIEYSFLNIGFLALFFIFAMVEVFGEFKNNDKIIYCTRPLVVPMLILFYIFGVMGAASISLVDWLIVIALIFGCLGDIFMMLRNQEKWFLFGVGAFLFNQVFYIISFFLSISDYTAFNLWGLFLLGPVILLIIFTVPRFIKKTENMKIPMLVYMSTILLMHIAALLRLAEFDGLEFILIYIGSIAFIFSDSLIAVKKWVGEFINDQLIIMTTYFMAQLFITLGALFSVLSYL